MARLTAAGSAVQRDQGGYTMVALLGILVLMGIWLTQVVQVHATEVRRADERELLRVGLAYRNALRRYAEAQPAGAPRAPARLSDLLQDPGVPMPRRFLRKLYPDPVARSPNWGLIYNPQGRIIGVFSQAPGEPLKQDGFDNDFAGFSGQRSYQGWRFVYNPDTGLGRGGAR